MQCFNLFLIFNTPILSFMHSTLERGLAATERGLLTFRLGVGVAVTVTSPPLASVIILLITVVPSSC